MLNKDYYEDGDSKNIIQRRDEFYEQNYQVNASYWQEATIDKRFQAGDQSLISMLYGNQNISAFKQLNFNLLRRQVNMISGYQRRNRRSAIAVGRNGDQEDALADDINAVLRYEEDKTLTQDILSESFENAVAVGSNFIHLYPNFLTDPISSNIELESVTYNNILIDAFYRKSDLSDCSGIWRRRWVDKNTAMQLIPGRGDEISSMKPQGLKDGKFYMQAELLNLNASKLYAYDEFYYSDFREARYIIDPQTDESVEWEDSERSDEELEQILILQPWLKVQKKRVPTVKLAISLNNRLMYNGPNLLEIDEYPFVPNLCYYDPDLPSYKWRLQGIIRNARDAQYLFTRVKIIQLKILESQINSGWIYKVDGLTDPKALRQTGEGYLIPVKGGDRPIQDILQRIESPGVPTTIMQLSESLAADVTRIIGTNEELLGSADDDKAGILAMLRQSAGLTTLNGIFDQLDTTYRILTRRRFAAIQKLYTPQKIFNILGRAPQPGFFSSKALQYKIAIEEGFYSTTQRQMGLKQALYLRELGIPIPNKSLMRMAILDDKAQIKKDMEEEQLAQQQQQEQQQRAQAEVEQEKLNIEKMKAYAQAKSNMASAEDKQALAQERQAKTQQIEAESEYTEVKKDHELVKQLIELENLDLRNLRDTLTLALEIKQINDNSSNQINDLVSYAQEQEAPL